MSQIRINKQLGANDARNGRNPRAHKRPTSAEYLTYLRAFISEAERGHVVAKHKQQSLSE